MTIDVLAAAPFVESRNIGPRQKRPTLITISLSDTTSDAGAALGVANYQHYSSSCHQTKHYIVDESQVIRAIDPLFSGACSPTRSLQVFICAQPTFAMDDWVNTSGGDALMLAADLVGELCVQFRIRPYPLNFREQLRWTLRPTRRRGGIDFQIPGCWPRPLFMQKVHASISAKKKRR